MLAARSGGQGLGVTTGGTDTHLITADSGPLGVDGLRRPRAVAAAGMVLDSYTLPHDTEPAGRPASGHRAVTTQGMREEQMPRSRT